MKKLFSLLLTAILIAGVTFAQSNVATVAQTGESSQASVAQLGPSNTAGVTQSGWWDFAKVAQTGGSNIATVFSNGSNNSVQFQILHNFLVPNSPLSYLGGMMGDGITQTGSLNHATVSQTSDFNWASVSQLSNSNQVTINQTALELGGQNIAGVDQLTGDGNVATLTQNAVDGVSYVLQKGAGNYASVSQFQNIGGNYYGGKSEIVQDGSSNSVIQSQTGSAVSYDGSFVSAQAFQIGNSNLAVQTQNGGGNSSLITSRGNNNGVVGDEIKTDQTGTWNTAKIEEGLLGAVNSSLASALQTGDFNNASVSQEGGNFNTARVTQSTSSNTATVSQNGATNISTVLQH